MAVIDKDLGWNDIKRELCRFKKSHTKIGVQEGERHKDEDGGETDLVVIAAANEFGSDHIPERPFIRSTVDEKDYFKQEIDTLVTKVTHGEMTCSKSLKVLGEKVQKDIQKKITDLRSPANAPATIKRKGSTNPLIDTGQMRSSIRHIEVIKGRG